MMFKKRAWKVFRTYDDGIYTSVIVGGRAELEYPLGVKVTSESWLRKKGYYPTVFTSYNHAKSFLLEHKFEYNSTIIEPVEIGDVVPFKPPANPILLAVKVIKYEDTEDKKFGWPNGTIMVKWVRRTENLALFAKLLKESERKELERKEINNEETRTTG
jgi:hypothetical protein